MLVAFMVTVPTAAVEGRAVVVVTAATVVVVVPEQQAHGGGGPRSYLSGRAGPAPAGIRSTGRTIRALSGGEVAVGERGFARLVTVGGATRPKRFVRLQVRTGMGTRSGCEMRIV